MAAKHPVWVYRNRLAEMEAELEKWGDNIVGMDCRAGCERQDEDGSCDQCSVIYLSDSIRDAERRLSRIEAERYAERRR